MFAKLRFALGNKILKRKYKHNRRTKKAVNLHQARNIGILIYPATIDEYEQSKGFIEQLRNNGARITMLVYIDDDELNTYFKKNPKINIITYHELNWLYIPCHPIVRRFINQDFDMLIDLSMQFSFPLIYITALSQAHFKVGLRNRQHQYFDLMLDVGNTRNRPYFLQQLSYYLQNIKTK